VTGTRPLLQLPAGISRETFLRDYWQQRPLLMRRALPPDGFPLEPDTLAGLACEETFESRLVIEPKPGEWKLRHGPFDAGDFAALPDAHWTLLVQDVDKYVPAVAQLIDAFDFVPTWRIDDIMVSYASDQGGVGPHSDAYDVFLMQGLGRRVWRLSFDDYRDDDLISGLEQRVLARFETDTEWVLEAGDVLYLPPGVAHWGVAEGACMTYSLGFRAPSQQDLAADWFQHLVALAGQQRLGDPPHLASGHSAALGADLQQAAANLLTDLPGPGSEEFRIWLGRYLTEPKPQFQILQPDDRWDLTRLRQWIAQGSGLARHPFARVTWSTLDGDRIALFCQGEARLLPAAAGPAVCLIAAQRRLRAATLSELLQSVPDSASLLVHLLNDGILEPVPQG
jgi:50S ribosomal protein L16 3-hydroxylase